MFRKSIDLSHTAREPYSAGFDLKIKTPLCMDFLNVLANPAIPGLTLLT